MSPRTSEFSKKPTRVGGIQITTRRTSSKPRSGAIKLPASRSTGPVHRHENIQSRFWTFESEGHFRPGGPRKLDAVHKCHFPPRHSTRCTGSLPPNHRVPCSINNHSAFPHAAKRFASNRRGVVSSMLYGTVLEIVRERTNSRVEYARII